MCPLRHWSTSKNTCAHVRGKAEASKEMDFDRMKGWHKDESTDAHAGWRVEGGAQA